MDKNGEQKTKLTLQPKDAGWAFDVTVILLMLFSFTISFFADFLKENIFGTILSYLCSPLAIVLAIVLLGCKKKQNLLRIFEFKKVPLIYLLASVLLTFGLLFGFSELNNLFVEFLKIFGYKSSDVSLPSFSPINVALVIIFVGIIPPIVEEFLFRGVILEGLKPRGDLFAIILSSLLFAIFHMNPQQTIYQFIAGLTFGLIALKCGSCIPAILCHLANNVLILLNYYFWNFIPNNVVYIVLTISGLLAFLIGLYLFVFYKKDFKKAQSKQSIISGIPVGIIICVVVWISNFFKY